MTTYFCTENSLKEKLLLFDLTLVILQMNNVLVNPSGTSVIMLFGKCRKMYYQQALVKSSKYLNLSCFYNSSL